MAGSEGAAATLTKEGPVLNMMSKRLRALKKKYNKILQIEESKSQGKSINKEQEEVLKTKISVATLIDEYEKLRQPLQVAVKEEVAEREKELMAATLHGGDGGEGSIAEEKNIEVIQTTQQKVVDEVRKETEMQDSAVCSNDTVCLNEENMNGGAPELEHAHDTSRDLHQQSSSLTVADQNIADLLTTLYFAQLFDVRSHGEASSSVLWTKAHERSSCLSYDCVTEDETSPLLETDLDDLSYLGSLLTSRPPNATFSHRDALQHCVEHAKLWLQNSEASIRQDPGLTYSRLRERLNRILSSEYFTMIPELQTVTQQTAVVAASATAQYASHLLVQKADDVPASDSTIIFVPQEQQPPYQIGEQHSTEPLPANPSLDPPGAHSQPSSSEIAREDKLKVDSCASTDENKESLPNGVQQEEIGPKSVDSSQQDSSRVQEGQQQQAHVPNVTVGPRGQQGLRGVGRGNNYGGRGRGYANGRGGRGGGGGRGGYGNGWSGQYYDQGGYYRRGYNGRGGGRSSRGGSSAFNGYMNGQATRGTVHGAA